MITEKFENPILLAEALIDLSDSSWNVTIPALNYFIKNNLPLIISQLNNNITAPLLRASMLSLSHRITLKSDTTEAKDLAFKIMGYASGIFSQGNLEGWPLPQEILEKEILPHLTPKGMFSDDPLRYFQRIPGTSSGLESALLVSKEWKEAALRVHKDWVCREIVRFEVYNCKTEQDVTQLVKRENLRIANFDGYHEVTETDLQELEECPNLSVLVLRNSYLVKIIPKALLKKLTHLILLSCYEINVKKLLEDLAECNKLTHFIFRDFLGQITSFRLESLVQHENLECLDLSGFFITEKVEIMSKFKKLKNLGLKNETNTNFQGKFEECLPQLSQLRGLRLNPSPEKLIDILPHLNLEQLEIVKPKTLVKLSENLPKLKNLQTLSFASCNDLTDEQIDIILPQFKKLSSLSIIFCQKITIKQIKKIFPQLKNLRKFHFITMQGSKNMYEELKELQAQFPYIEIISFSRSFIK